MGSDVSSSLLFQHQLQGSDFTGVSNWLLLRFFELHVTCDVCNMGDAVERS